MNQYLTGISGVKEQQKINAAGLILNVPVVCGIRTLTGAHLWVDELLFAGLCKCSKEAKSV